MNKRVFYVCMVCLFALVGCEKAPFLEVASEDTVVEEATKSVGDDNFKTLDIVDSGEPLGGGSNYNCMSIDQDCFDANIPFGVGAYTSKSAGLLVNNYSVYWTPYFNCDIIDNETVVGVEWEIFTDGVSVHYSSEHQWVVPFGSILTPTNYELKVTVTSSPENSHDPSRYVKTILSFDFTLDLQVGYNLGADKLVVSPVGTTQEIECAINNGGGTFTAFAP